MTKAPPLVCAILLTASVAALAPAALARPSISSVPPIILAGASFPIIGGGFTAGSMVNFFVATARGPINAGPLTPSSRTAGNLEVNVPVTTPLGEGFVTVEVVNIDQQFAVSNPAYALLQGAAAAGIPTIQTLDGIGLAATSNDPAFGIDNVETVVRQGNVVQLGGSGFDTANGVAIDLFCACAGGKVGPFMLSPGAAGLSATLLSFTLPAAGLPSSPPIGPGAFVVSNRGAAGAYVRKSNAVSAPIGERISVDSVVQSGSRITVDGAGFSILTAINFFNTRAMGVVNLGGLNVDGSPKIPLSFIGPNRFDFTVPPGAAAGASYVQALNPPFVPFTSSGAGSGGAFQLAPTPTPTASITPTPPATVSATPTPAPLFVNPQRVTINGYSGDAMEPFITRDDSMLFFNNSNQSADTNLYWATRSGDLTFVLRGQIGGVNSAALDAVASMDAAGNFYFISTRSYFLTLSTIYRGIFSGGAVSSISLVGGVSKDLPGWVNFDAEISADGNTLYFVDGFFGAASVPQTAKIVIARRAGTGFERDPSSDTMMGAINTDTLNYAPDTSADELEIFFTRLDPGGPAIYTASRASTAHPFGTPHKIEAITGFAEAPSIAPGGHSLYYHHNDAGVFNIYRVTR